MDGSDWIAERGFDLSKLNWMRQQDLSDLARPIDNSTAVVGGDAAAGRLDFYTRWEPNTYCPLHRHLGDTVSVVLQGEHIIEELDGSKRSRPPGHYGFTRTGELHYEQGGPQGSVVFFSMQSKDGRAFGVEDREGNSLGIITVAEMLAGEMLPL